MRYQEELTELERIIEGNSYNRRAPPGSPSTAEVCLESYRHKMKGEKLGFIDAETRASLLQGCKDGLALNTVDSTVFQRQREEAKQQVKEMKRRLHQEEEEQAKLHETLKEAYLEAHGAHHACQRELEQLHMTQRDYSEIGGELSDHGTVSEEASGSSFTTGCQPQDVQTGFKMLHRIQSANEEESKKRRALEAEVARLEERLKQQKAESHNFELQRDQEQELVGHKAKIHQALLELGFSEITFDDAKGVVVLGGAGVNSLDEALRTVSVGFDKDGKLTKAMPHRSLALQNEATDAVQLDDLPWLMTKVWHRINCGQEKPKPTRGGA